jgi:type VI secretion system protein ImpG
MLAKLHQRIDDNSGHIAFHILNATYPNLVNSLPSCSVIHFGSGDKTTNTGILEIYRETYLSIITKRGNGCLFRTLYSLTIYPISIQNICLEKKTIKLRFKTNNAPIENMNIDTLLLHINSNILHDAMMIYEAIFSAQVVEAYISVRGKIIRMKDMSIVPKGFNDEDTICPVTAYTVNSFQLFQEVLHFRQKFMFFDVRNIGATISASGEVDLDEFELHIKITAIHEKLLQIVKKDLIMMNCVPIANLFKCTSDPFRFDGEKTKYLLLADQLRGREIEIHSIVEVHKIDAETSNDEIVQPYFSLSANSDANIHHELFWVHSKESSNIRGFEENDTFLSFIDTNLNPKAQYDDIIYAKLLCTNRIEARDIPIGARMDIEKLEAGSVYGSLLYKISETINFSNETTNLWNLVSQLSSIHMPLSDGENLLMSVKKLLSIFCAGMSVKSDELVSQIAKIISSMVVKRFGDSAWRGFVEGIEFNVLVRNEEKSYLAFLLCSIINQYLSASVSLNAFVQVNMLSEKTNQKLASWLPTSGRKNVI